MTSQRRLTASRAGRLALLGRLAGGIGGGLVGAGLRQLAQGKRPKLDELLLTPANARRLTERLAEMRGAAMKLGQLLSMDGGQVLPPQVSEILAKLRTDAYQMPLNQVASVLNHAWGDNWERQFSRFAFTPIAAASIGQVHEAVLKDGQRVAIKIQYPEVRASIDADVDNVASLLRLARLLPDDFDSAPLLGEAKRQLHRETDYHAEAAALARFTELLVDDDRYRLPAVVDSLSTTNVLTMQFLDGHEIERLAELPAQQRNTVAESLTDLALREVFDWGLVQTDPNFANYLYDPGNAQLQLLDFGAARDYPTTQRTNLNALLNACIDGDDGDLADSAQNLGYLREDDPARYRQSIVDLLRSAAEPVRTRGTFDFGSSDLAQRMTERVVQLRQQQGFAGLPPAEILFLHRRLGGLYLLLAHLRAEFAVRPLIKPWLDRDPSGEAVAAQGSARIL